VSTIEKRWSNLLDASSRRFSPEVLAEDAALAYVSESVVSKFEKNSGDHRSVSGF